MALIVCFMNTILAVTILVPWGLDPVTQEDVVELAGFVPEEIVGWHAESAGNYYDKETIFQYMDGSGEIYLSYEYRGMFVRTFVSGESEPIYVELFDMGCPADAFGVFTRNRQGSDAGIGQGSEYESGYLMFWRGRYFCSVYSLLENEESKKVVFDLGRSISDSIGKDGPLPGLLGLLPEVGRKENSESYFHKHTCLNHHYFVADENILSLDSDTEAAMADYLSASELYHLLIIHYPDESRTQSAMADFREVYLQKTDSGAVTQLENEKWTGASALGRYLAIVLDAPSGESADAALRETLENAGRKGDER